MSPGEIGQRRVSNSGALYLPTWIMPHYHGSHDVHHYEYEGFT
jgi:hypothetical protein